VKAQLALEIGGSKMVKGIRVSGENTRSGVATALGYPGRHQEDFLDIGGAILKQRYPGSLIVDYFVKGFGNHFQILDWLIFHFDDLKLR
jgi:hypothetical protein